MPILIDASEAKMRLLTILRQVRQGTRFTITVRGQPVAELVPSTAVNSTAAEAAVEAMKQFPRVHGVSAEDVAAWIKEGRR
jgi:prevent-host-death family protein